MTTNRRRLLSFIPASLILYTVLSFQRKKRVKLEILYQATTSNDLQTYLGLVNSSKLLNIKDRLIKKNDSISILSDCKTKLFSTHLFDSIDDLVQFKRLTTAPGVVGKKERQQLGIRRVIKITHV